MKYEYLCGYESDFFAMPENVIAVVRLDYCVQGLTEFNQITECGKPVLAMRRIIAEPKRWTVADQKAGRLPEVGSKAVLAHDSSVVDILAVSNGCVVVCHPDVVGARPCVFTEANFLEIFKPIESPEEKAQREEDEFVFLVESEYSKKKETSFRAGIRAAYRKLKGGE